MERLVKELRQLMKFKKELDEGDVVLLAGKDPDFIAFGVVTAIERDESRRDEWWHVSMQLLSVPLQPMTWTLRTEQMTGQETFTMGGHPRFMAPLAIGPERQEQSVPESERKPAGSGKIVSLHDAAKKQTK